MEKLNYRNLSNLRELSLSYNFLRDVPEEVLNFKHAYRKLFKFI